MTHDENVMSKLTVGEAATKTYLTTKQFFKVLKSFDDDKYKELKAAWDAAWGAAWSAARDAAWGAAWSATRSAAWDAARYDAWDPARDAAWDAAWSADLAIVVRDKISPDQFNILVQPWTSCGLSLYAEDWEQVLNPKVVEHPKIVEPKNFGAIVEASTRHYGFQSWFLAKNGTWTGENEHHIDWSDLVNPIIISEGVES